MCGVTAVYGNYATLKAMFVTLNQLERGVEGCGIAYLHKNRIKIVKQPTHPMKFIEDNANKIFVKTNMCIAHNRQPSIGKISYENTHPFMDCKNRFALAHNGHAFVNNMKLYLETNGHKINGETDSEILTHLLEEYYEQTSDMISALKKLVENYLSGSIVVLTRDRKIYCAKNGFVTLYCAINDDNIYIASSQNAIKALLRMLREDDYLIFEVSNGEIIEINDRGDIDFHIAEVRKPKRHHTIYYPDFEEWFYKYYYNI